MHQVIVLKQENQDRSRDMRKQIRTLVEGRLANRISHDEYTAGRKLANAVELECKRLHWVLHHEFIRRQISPRQRRAERLSRLLPQLMAGLEA